MSVSVVLPVGGVDDDLGLQLAALSEQSFDRDFEVVLSLNSPDRSQSDALDRLVSQQEHLNCRVVDSSDVRSASHARNVGAARADGDVLAFCDGDDIADQGWLQHLVARVEPGVAVGGFLEEDLLAVPGQEEWRPPATPDSLPTFLNHPFLVSANMAVTRHAFEQVGGFDTTLTRGEDIAFSWDLIELGIEMAYCPEAIMYYRHRKGLWPMMKQHYLYGIGFSQILARRGPPGSDGSASLGALRPNNQKVDKKSIPYVLRRGSIASGRVVGLVQERAAQRS